MNSFEGKVVATGNEVVLKRDKYEQLVKEASINNAMLLKIKREKKTSKINIEVSVKKIDSDDKIMDVTGMLVIDTDASGSKYAETVKDIISKINKYAFEISSEYNEKISSKSKRINEADMEIQKLNGTIESLSKQKKVFKYTILALASINIIQLVLQLKFFIF